MNCLEDECGDVPLAPPTTGATKAKIGFNGSNEYSLVLLHWDETVVSGTYTCSSKILQSRRN